MDKFYTPEAYPVNEASFRFVNEGSRLSDTKFETKPTTFAKDAVKRFRKNKSSVVAAIILGILILLTLVVPIISNCDVDRVSASERFLQPKLFPAGTGFWDGTKTYKKSTNLDGSSSGIMYDRENDVPAGFYRPAVLEGSLEIDEEPTLINQATKYGAGGFVMFENQNSQNVAFKTSTFEATADNSYAVEFLMHYVGDESAKEIGGYRVLFKGDYHTLYLTLPEWNAEDGALVNVYDEKITLDLSAVLAANDITREYGYLVLEIGSQNGNYEYVDAEDFAVTADENVSASVLSALTLTKTNQNTTLRTEEFEVTANGHYAAAVVFGDTDGVGESQLGEYRVYFETTDGTKTVLRDWGKTYENATFDLSEAARAAGVDSVKGRLTFELKPDESDAYSYILIRSVELTSDEGTPNHDDLADFGFTDATNMVLKAKNSLGEFPKGYWQCTGRKGVYASEVYFCSFIYDTYAAVYDAQETIVAASDLNKYIANGWCSYDSKEGPESFVRLSDECPIDGVASQKLNSKTGKLLEVTALASRFRKMGYNKMPIYLLGTDANGVDVLTRIFTGLRTSLLLGVCTFLFCFFFGLVWGSISGYFGGAVDLFMERFCDILGGVPWIVIMTLCILHFGNNFFTFFLALCMTGWMGTAGGTRTQFYRFKNQEYVLASRTLGSGDMRLIFKHILPNSLGTIVTSSVLMIPSVIFSESTLAYLHLGLQGVASFGVTLAENQQYIKSYSYLIVFPSIIMAFLMISFNLFGNGLRDAINPALKGSD